MTLPERVESFLFRVENEVESLSAGTSVDDARKLKKLSTYRELMQGTRPHKSTTTEHMRNKARLILLEVYATWGKEATSVCMLASTITDLGLFKDDELPTLMLEIRKRWNVSTPRLPRLAALAASFFDEQLVVSIISAIQRGPRCSFQNSGEPNCHYGITVPLISRRHQRQFKCPTCLDRAWLVFRCAPHRFSCRRPAKLYAKPRPLTRVLAELRLKRPSTVSSCH